MQTMNKLQYDIVDPDILFNQFKEQLQTFQKELITNILTDTSELFIEQLKEVTNLNCDIEYYQDKHGCIPEQKREQAIRLEGVLQGINMVQKILAEQYNG
jgi:hypothetical protein